MERDGDRGAAGPDHPAGRHPDERFVFGGHARESTDADVEERRRRQVDLARRLREEEVHGAAGLRGVTTQQGAAHGRPAKHRWAKKATAVLLVVALVGAGYLLQRRGGFLGQPGPIGNLPASNVTSPVPATPRIEGVPTVPSGATERLAPAVAAPATAAGQYAFSRTQDASSAPVAFDPCRTIHYALNPAGAPAEMNALVSDAVAEISAATGLVFADDGATDEAPSEDRDPYQPDRYGDRWAPVLIAWSDEARTPGLAGQVGGQGGAISVTDPYLEDTWVNVSGSITLDIADLGAAMQAGADRQVRATIVHELGHVVGLDHVDEPSQLMYPETTPGNTELGAGDRFGLAQLGAQECHPQL